MSSTIDNQSALSEVAFESGEYSGHCLQGQDLHEMQELVAGLSRSLQSDQATLIAGGRNQNLRLETRFGSDAGNVLVKSFGQQSWLKDRLDLANRKSKAQRSFLAAAHLLNHEIGTPTPIAYVQKVKNDRITESYFLSEFKDDAINFHEALLFLLHNQPTASDLMPLLEQVAVLCRKMHDSGFIHNDLGNQNILLTQQSEKSWSDPCVIDLNRGKIFPELSEQQRGRDLSRLAIPSNLMAMFLDMYWGSPVPESLQAAYQRYARRYGLHARTRKLRHPFREARIARESAKLPATRFMPSPRELWIWDDTSDQALSPLDRRERTQQYPASRSWRLLWDSLTAAIPLWRRYKQVKGRGFNTSVQMEGRVGIAVGPTPATLEQELTLLESLGPIPVLVRCCHHDTAEQTKFQIELIKRLSAAGHAVTLALVQDRRAISEQSRWQSFVMDLLQELAQDIVAIEFGHAINRVKWGIWSFEELRRFYAPLPKISEDYPDLKIIGPATIDFEYPFLLSALKVWPATAPLAAMSHHLYVDRRGAPENQQNGFSAVEKFALAQSIANLRVKDASEVVVTEVNWPVAGTLKYSPVTAPFNYRDAAPESLHDSGESEQACADYMVRYLVLAVCSGFVGQVFWWRLVAKGYGLIDIDGEILRERPGFLALKHFINVLSTATFIKAELPMESKANEGVYRMQFRREDGELLWLCWQHGSPGAFPTDIVGESIQDCLGNTLENRPVELQGSPVYIRNCTN